MIRSAEERVRNQDPRLLVHSTVCDDLAWFIEFDLPTNQAVREPTRIYREWRNVPCNLWRILVVTAPEDHFEDPLASLIGTAMDEGEKVRFHLHRKRAIGGHGKVCACDVDARRPAFCLASSEGVDEQGGKNLHARRLHLQSGVVPHTLSEVDSKSLLSSFGVPFCREEVVEDLVAAAAAASRIGYPVVLKANASTISHKSELGLVRLDLRDPESLASAYEEITGLVDAGSVNFIVAEMASGNREIIVGLVRDATCGDMVLLGAGGVFAEAIEDVVLLPFPIGESDVERAIVRLRSRRLFGAVRGEEPVNLQQLTSVVMGVQRLANSDALVRVIDINPLIVSKSGSLVAVDALVEMHDRLPKAVDRRQTPAPEMSPLFNPRGVVVVGASSHPGKFGFVSIHNILANGYRGRLYGLNQSGEQVLGASMITDISELPKNEVDLAFLCTPAAINEEILRRCAERGVRAAFVASAGYRELGNEGERLERALASTARELGMVLAGPNGQGLVSTPANLCAQIVAPFPPRGSISVVSQSGNFVSSFLNMSKQTGRGIARAVSAGNSAVLNVADYLDFFSTDAATSTTIAYVESIDDGPAFFDAVQRHCEEKPLVVVKGGRTESGKRAASSHTGALASDYRAFAAKCEHVGATVVSDPEEAFDCAAAFDTLPLPRGDRLAILTTVGGWGVVSSDVVHDCTHLRLGGISDSLLSNLDDVMPARWSRNNPLDCAGGETRETVTTALRMLCESGEFDLILLLGVGIQGNQARMMIDGPYAGDLTRITDYHERQEMRYVDAAADLAAEFGIPVALASEIAVTDPLNATIRQARERSVHVFASGPRAVRSLDRLAARAHRLREAR